MLQGDLWIALGKFKEAHDTFAAAVAMAEEIPELSADKRQEAFIAQQSCLYAQGKNDIALSNLVPLLEDKTLSLFVHARPTTSNTRQHILIDQLPIGISSQVSS